MSEFVKIEENGPILTLTLDRPEKLNAINESMLATIFEQALRFETEPSLQVLLLRANGRYFSAGGDLHSKIVPDLSSRSPRAVRAWFRRDGRSFTPLGELLEGIGKPVVVAHQGPCFGAGLEVSLSFDFRLAAESAIYYLPETLMGAVPSAGGTARLTRLIGAHWARWLLIAGQKITGRKAENIGLIHACYPDDGFDNAVMEFCRSLAEMPAEAVAATKIAIELATDLGSSAARSVERLATSSLVFGAEFKANMDVAQKKLDR